MKVLMSCCLILWGMVLVDAHASANFSFEENKSLYGDDNRRLISDLDSVESSIQIAQSRSVLIQIPKWRVSSENAESISIETKSLESGMNFCSDEKFSQLPLVGSCTAFLVGPDLLLTAGHCVKDKFECQKNYWALDYNDSLGFAGSKGVATIKKENLVTCAQLISQSENAKLDYALIKINRNLPDRLSLAIRRVGKLDDADLLEVIGHPMGMPKILANDAKIRNNSLPYTFVTNADTFSGNSGSPVINSKTHLVEGILIRGEQDFTMDINLGCNRSYQCFANECRGETVQRTSVLPIKLIPKI